MKVTHNSNMQITMTRKRGLLVFFLIAAFVTLFTNFIAIKVLTNLTPSSVSVAETGTRTGTGTGTEYAQEMVREISTAENQQIQTNILLNYRVIVNRNNASGWTSANVGLNYEVTAGVSAAAAMDDEMILNHPMTLPENLINCSTNSNPAKTFNEGDTTDENGKSRTFKRASFTITANLVRATREVNCGEYVTYTTHGDFRYLDNLVPIVERWVGPVSITLYAPGADLRPTLDRIFYLRECTTPLIKEWITFHLFSDTRYFIDPAPFLAQIENNTNANSDICKDVPEFNEKVPTIRTKRRLLYPVNVARNVARQEAQTHYILASDIELYPSLNLIPDFLDLLTKNESLVQFDKNPRHVFVLPVFEIETGFDIPEKKEQLVDALRQGTAVPFHKYICPQCHIVPKYDEWLDVGVGVEDELDVFHVAKRTIPFHIWEPIYIGTNSDPFYDERLSWEGLRDKMSQGYAMCVLNYDFMILDNAFLIHRPGINRKKHNMKKPSPAMRKQNRIIQRKVQKELNKLYGTRRGCVL